MEHVSSFMNLFLPCQYGYRCVLDLSGLSRVSVIKTLLKLGTSEQLQYLFDFS